MHPRILATLAALSCAGSATAQFPLQGFLYNWDRPTAAAAISVFVRWGFTAETVLSRIDRSDYPEWGVNLAGQTQIQGFMAWVDDANDATVESFNVVAFQEDAANADFPDMATPLLNVGPVPMPPTGNPPGARAWRLAATLTLPVNLDGTKDVFVGVGLPAMIVTTQPYDGLFVGSVSNDPASAPFPFDVPGPTGAQGAGIGQDSYVCYVPTGQAPRYVPSSPVSLEQLAFDVHVSAAAGGVALATTPQANFTASNVLGTTDFLSGLHPDIPRGDNIGFAVTSHTSQVLTGSPAFVMMGFAPSPFGSVPISAFPGLDPSSSGNLCIDTTSALSFFILLNPGQTNSLANMLEGQFVFTLSASDRALIASQPPGFDIWWQAFVVDGGNATLEIHSTSCVRQHLR